VEYQARVVILKVTLRRLAISDNLEVDHL
jgi:hypothetical protein